MDENVTTNWLCACGDVLTSRTSRDHVCPDAGFWRRRRRQIELEMRECLESGDAERGRALVEAAREVDGRIAAAERGF